jgi:transposase InsO family protein
MPWLEVSTMSSRQEFVLLCVQPGANMARLCRRFGISRKTGYKWRTRFLSGGAQALSDHSRRPHRSPARTRASVEKAIVRLRKQRHWGGRKLQSRLAALGHRDLPAISTISGILKRCGLIDVKLSEQHRSLQRFERAAPNELWQMDFKGHFAMRQGRCHPLTVLDDHSRYALALRACADERAQTVMQQLTTTFRRYGLPEWMLMDNGPPWGAPHEQIRLTALAIWLIRLGIRITHGRAYHPQTQGKDERFHRTLNTELIQRHAFRDLQQCQRHFDRWRDIYNLERPHEGIRMQVPAQRYQPSTRSFPKRLPAIQYDAGERVRKVQNNGEVSFQGRSVRLSQALHGAPVAFRPTTQEGIWQVYFCHQQIAVINLRECYRT